MFDQTISNQLVGTHITSRWRTYRNKITRECFAVCRRSCHSKSQFCQNGRVVRKSFLSSAAKRAKGNKTNKCHHRQLLRHQSPASLFSLLSNTLVNILLLLSRYELGKHSKIVSNLNINWQMRNEIYTQQETVWTVNDDDKAIIISCQNTYVKFKI